MEDKKIYEKPQITDSQKLQTQAGACFTGKIAGMGGGCVVMVNS